eukprot:4259394-Amphidinium_carterae.1
MFSGRHQAVMHKSACFLLSWTRSVGDESDSSVMIVRRDLAGSGSEILVRPHLSNLAMAGIAS